MRKDSLFVQFMGVVAAVGVLLAVAMGYIVSVPLVGTLAEIEERPLHLISDDIYGMVSDTFHELLDLRHEDNPVEVEAAKQDVLARIGHFRPSVASGEYFFVVLDGSDRILLDSGNLFAGLPAAAFREGSAPGKLRLSDGSGRPLVGYLKYFPGWRWRIVALIHEENLRRETLQVKVWIYATGLVGFLLVLALVYALLKKRIQEPLAALVRYANGYEEGRRAPLPEGGKGEVRDLLMAFERMTSAIRERENRLAELAKLPESNPNILIKVSPGGKVLYANPSVAEKLAELGLSQDDPALLLPPRIADIFRSLRPEERRRKVFDWKVGGRTIHYFVFGFPDEDAVVFHGIDVTDRKLMEEQLLHAHKMETLGRLAGGVAHDFNNLLVGILGYATLLKEQPHHGETVAKAAASIETAAERGAQMVRRLLGFARKGTHESRPLELNRIVDETADIIGRTIDRSITIRRESAPDLPAVMGDGTQVHQCLMNLCVNARDAMPDGGILSVVTRRVLLEPQRPDGRFPIPPGLYAVVEIADRGRGMDEETLARIFDPYFTTKDRDKGIGLGMSLVYSIVKNHGGFITVRSVPGQGTTVTLFFPAGRTIEQPREVPTWTPAAAPRPGAGTVLLVDDEESVRDVGTAMLGALGYEVVTAVNGREGVDVFRRLRDSISFVILDLMMPVMDGRKAFEEIREIDPRARIVISTGYSGDQDVDRLREMGAGAVLPKPYTYTTLSRTVAFIETV